jgi:hypothetical protein
MNRPAARFDASTAPPPAAAPQSKLFDCEGYLRKTLERRKRTAQLPDQVMAHMRNNPRRAFCGVEIAELFGCHFYEAKHCLRRLEAGGLLRSHHETAPRSGQGRRYYKLRGVP